MAFELLHKRAWLYKVLSGQKPFERRGILIRNGFPVAVQVQIEMTQTKLRIR